MLREALASGRGKAANVDEIDSVAEEDGDAIDQYDDINGDFFMDSAMQELCESERDDQSVGGSDKDAVVTEGNVCRALEEPVSRTTEGRGRFRGKSHSTSSSSSDDDSIEGQHDDDLMTAFTKVTVEEIRDSTVRPLTAVESPNSPAGLSENEQDDDLGSAIADDGVRGESLESSGRRGRRKAAGVGKVSKQGDVGPGTVKGARRRRRHAVKAAKDGRAKGDEDDGLGCRICGMQFPSRSKLFAHVKAEGHAVLA